MQDLMADLNRNASGNPYDIMSAYVKDLGQLDFSDDQSRIYVSSDSISTSLDSIPEKVNEYVYSSYSQYRRQDAVNPLLDTNSAVANDVKTQAIYDFCYDTLRLKLETSKKISASYDYMYPYASYKPPNSSASEFTIEPSLLPAKSIDALNNRYASRPRNKYATGESNLCFKVRYPYVSFYYTMIAVLYSGNNAIVGFRLYDWLTDTAADYTYESVKQRLTEASVRITNLEVFGATADKQLVCTQGKFEWYTRLNESGEPVNLYRPFVYLTPLHINSGVYILVDYTGVALAAQLNMSVLSVGIANLALACSPSITMASKSFKTALPFGSIPLIPGEDFIGHVHSFTFYQGDAFTYTCYRAFLLPSICTTAWASMLKQTAKSSQHRGAYASVFQFYTFSMCFFNGKFAQYLVPIHAMPTAEQRNYDSDATDNYDYSSPMRHLADIFPLYPDLESNGLITSMAFKSRSYASTYLRATDGTLVKVRVTDKSTSTNRAEIQDRVIVEDGRCYKCLRDPLTYRFPRGYFDMPYVAFKFMETYHDLNSTFEMINAGMITANSNEPSPFELKYNYARDIMDIQATKPVMLRKLGVPLNLTTSSKQELIEGSASLFTIGVHSSSEAINNLVVNITTGSSLFMLVRATSRFEIKTLTLNGNFTYLPAFCLAYANPLVDRTDIGAPYLTNVVIPDTISVIGAAAFRGQSRLRNVNIPSNLKVIDAEAFMMCESITHLELPEGLRVIGARAFAGCEGLQSIVIPSTVTFIGAEAFRDCDLQSVIIKREPGTIEIAEGAFDGNGIAVDSIAEKYEGIPLGVDVAAWRKKKEEGKTVVTITASSTENAKNNLYTKHFLDLYGSISADSVHVKPIKKADYSDNSLVTSPEKSETSKRTRRKS